MKIIFQRDICTPIFIPELFTIARILKQVKCPSTNEWITNIWYIYIMEYCSAMRKDTDEP